MALCLPSQIPFPDLFQFSHPCIINTIFLFLFFLLLFLLHPSQPPFLPYQLLCLPVSFTSPYAYSTSVTSVSPTVVLSTEATFLFLFPIFLQKTKIRISPHQPALHPESPLILAPFFFHPFLSCFYLGFRLFSLLEYLLLDTPTCCLFWDRALLCIPGSYVLPVYSSSLMLKTAMGHHARLCSLYQEPLFLEVPWDDLFSPLSSLSPTTQGSSCSQRWHDLTIHGSSSFDFWVK